MVTINNSENIIMNFKENFYTKIIGIKLKNNFIRNTFKNK